VAFPFCHNIYVYCYCFIRCWNAIVVLLLLLPKEVRERMNEEGGENHFISRCLFSYGQQLMYLIEMRVKMILARSLRHNGMECQLACCCLLQPDAVRAVKAARQKFISLPLVSLATRSNVAR
jgi:hypothetical protein